jgi:hypothetical protein
MTTTSIPNNIFHENPKTIACKRLLQTSKKYPQMVQVCQGMFDELKVR